MTSNSATRVSWQPGTHESRVEKFYSRGADCFGGCHGGYLNFGLWQPGFTYLQAAENLVSHLVTWGGVNGSSRLLDVACGFGVQDLLIARRFAPAHIIGVDVTFPHVLAAQKRAREAGFDKVLQFQHGSGTDLQFPAESFTHVLSVEGVVHFNTREKFFRQAHHVLAHGGVLMLADYALARRPRKILDRAVLRATCRSWQVPDENVDTIESYRTKLERSGFSEVEVVAVGNSTIPHYFREQATRRHFSSMLKIRGPLAALGGLAIDWLAFQAWKRGHLDYVLVRAVKR